jgi:hypothetical protein
MYDVVEVHDGYTVGRRLIPWHPYSPEDPRPLNRHVRHDSRSLRYLVAAEDGTDPDVEWQRYIDILNQGDIGSCTGNAQTGQLGADGCYQALSQLISGGLDLDEAEAVALYSLATSLDDYSGTYPPTDTGSDGLSVAKAAQQKGLISGYEHITSLAAAKAAIKVRPFITGINWYDGFDNPDSTGYVSVSGNVRGGHEFLIRGYKGGLWIADNSWGTGFGVNGSFNFNDADYTRLLSEDGDATQSVPLNAPAPTPTPPTPTPISDEADAAFVKLMDRYEEDFLNRVFEEHKIKKAYDVWKAAKGY